MATPTPLRIACIGAGANTRLRHIPGFQAIPGVQVVAVCNRSRESGERAAREFGIPRVCTDPEELFADPAVDAVCIGTWPYKHAEFTLRALEAGKHVLCEARMAATLAEARQMLAAHRRHPELVAQLVPAPFDLRCGPTIRRLVDEGAIGEPLEVVVTLLSGDALDREAPAHWRQRVEYSGHNVLMLGIFNEMVQRWLGDTVRVVADAAVFTPTRRDPETGRALRIEIPDSVGVLARMAVGARATYHQSAVCHAPPPAGISVYGRRGVIHWRTDDTFTLARLGEAPQPREPDPGLAGSWRVEQDFVDSVREGKPVTLTSFEDGERYMNFVEGVWRSWQEGRAVDLPLP